MGGWKQRRSPRDTIIIETGARAAMRVDGNSRGARGSTTKPGSGLTKDQRAAISTAMERRDAEQVPVALPRLDFLERRLPGEPKSLSERWK